MAVFEADRPFVFFDHFRIPYAVTGSSSSRDGQPNGAASFGSGGFVRSRGPESRALSWPAFEPAARALQASLEHGEDGREPIPIYGRVLPDADVQNLLNETSGSWIRSAWIKDARGNSVGAVWQDELGNVFVPFDPNEIINNYWSENYLTIARSAWAARASALARRSYYLVRPGLPRPVQIWIRRIFRHLQGRSRFPRWPVETALHDFFDWLLQSFATLAREPVPWISAWPDGYDWAFIVTHDVESAIGYRNIDVLKQVEIAADYRSCWNLVPTRYEVDEAFLQEMRESGFEIGVHGLHHDGRDLASLRKFNERLPAIRHYAERWDAAGFRSCATHRVWQWMPRLGFDYDSSYPDTDPFEPQPGGCCSWLPYFNDDMVELPITLPQDHTLFVILGLGDERVWVEKTEHIKRRGGMALLVTHPDYVDPPSIEAYRRLLERYRSDGSVWRALPRDVSDWWRRRAASTLERGEHGWRIAGPAAREGRIAFAETSAASPGRGIDAGPRAAPDRVSG